MSDINTAVVDSLKALDPERPIREADIGCALRHRFLCHFIVLLFTNALTMASILAS